MGARFDDRVAGNPPKFARRAKFIAHLDIDASEINKVKRVDWSHVGDAERCAGDAARLCQAQRNSSRDWSGVARCAASELKRKHAMNYDRASELIQPYYVIEEINRLTRGEAIITTGVGQHQMWAAQYFDFTNPRLWLTSGSMGTMGFGLPAAVGAQFAQRSRLVIDIDGDASIRMNLGELETVTTYDLPVKVVVLNNCGDGMVKQWQKLFFKGRLSASDKSLHTKDFVKAALADGFKYAVRLDKKTDVPRVVAEFVSFPGPAFLEVMIDQDAGVYPMVGPGQAYDEMITGEHIASRTEVEIKPPDASKISRRSTRRRCSACLPTARPAVRTRPAAAALPRSHRGADERHAPVARWAIDGHAMLAEALACRVDVLDGVGQMAEIAAPTVGLGIPVMGELDLRALITRGAQEDQRVASLRVVAARQFKQSERVPIEVQGLLDVGHADHRMQILHGKISRRAPGIWARIWSNPCTKAN